MHIDYSVAIRTTGKGGEKYQKLLDSLKIQTVLPNEILVVLPEGADLPGERLGTEKFIFAPRGMMTQRIFGVENARNEIVLCCDDDIEFDKDFVQKLLRPILDKSYDIVVGELLAFLPPKGKFKNISSILSLSAIPMGKGSGKYVRIIRSGGWKYYRFDPNVPRYLPTESAAGTMLMTTKTAWTRLRFKDELWAQHGALAPMEDQIMFYKAFLQGSRVAVVTDAHYIHNDSKNSLSNAEAKIQKSRYSGYNHRVFWQRFIYDQQKNKAARIVSHYLYLHKYLVGRAFMLATSIYKPERRSFLKEMAKGEQAAKSFIKSDSYAGMKPIYR